MAQRRTPDARPALLRVGSSAPRSGSRSGRLSLVQVVLVRTARVWHRREARRNDGSARAPVGPPAAPLERAAPAAGRSCRRVGGRARRQLRLPAQRRAHPGQRGLRRARRATWGALHRAPARRRTAAGRLARGFAPPRPRRQRGGGRPSRARHSAGGARDRPADGRPARALRAARRAPEDRLGRRRRAHPAHAVDGLRLPGGNGRAPGTRALPRARRDVRAALPAQAPAAGDASCGRLPAGRRRRRHAPRSARRNGSRPRPRPRGATPRRRPRRARPAPLPPLPRARRTRPGGHRPPDERGHRRRQGALLRRRGGRVRPRRRSPGSASSCRPRSSPCSFPRRLPARRAARPRRTSWADRSSRPPGSAPRWPCSTRSPGVGLVHTLRREFAEGGALLAEFALAMGLFSLANVLVGYHLSRGETRYAWIVAAMASRSRSSRSQPSRRASRASSGRTSPSAWPCSRRTSSSSSSSAPAIRAACAACAGSWTRVRRSSSRGRSSSSAPQFSSACSSARDPGLRLHDRRHIGPTRPGRSGGSGTSSRRAATTSSARTSTCPDGGALRLRGVQRAQHPVARPVLPGLPAAEVFGPVAAINLVVLSGLRPLRRSMYALTRYLGCAPLVAAWAGWCTSSSRRTSAGRRHPSLIHFEVLALVLLARRGLRAARVVQVRPRRPRPPPPGSRRATSARWWASPASSSGWRSPSARVPRRPACARHSARPSRGDCSS